MAGARTGQVHGIFKVKAEGRARLIVFDTQDLSLGRSPENDLSLDDPELSRRHAIFVRTPEGCRIKDMGTPNGTCVNGESVDHAPLASGDVVRVGAVEITYAETARDPVSLGKAVEFASHLKNFAVSLPEGDSEETMLGSPRSEGVAPPTSTESELDAALDLLGEEAPDPIGGPPRNLDAELGGFGTPGPGVLPPALPPTPVDSIWELEDSDPDVGGLDLGTAPGTGPLVLRIELAGLDGELRRALEGLAGKLVELPRLCVKIETGE